MPDYNPSNTNQLMKKVISAIAIFSVLLFLGCNRHSKNDIVVFPSSKKVTLNVVDIPHVLARPINLIILNDKIIINDLLTEWILKIFSSESYEFKGDLIRRGRGPMEETGISEHFRSYGNEAFLYKSTGTVKVAKIDSSNGDLDHVVIDEFALPPDMYSDDDFFLLNDKIYSSITFQPTTRDFRCFDITTNIPYEWGELLPLQRPKSLHPNDIFYLAKFTTVNPDHNLLAVVYQNFPILRIYCTKSGQVLSQQHMADGSNNIKFFKRNSFEEGFLTYYWRIKSTKEYIYALYPGTGLSWEDENIPDLATVIHIWKWDGTPVMKLELDRPIFSFDVTPDNKQLIASSIVDVDKLFVAEIPWN